MYKNYSKNKISNMVNDFNRFYRYVVSESVNTTHAAASARRTRNVATVIQRSAMTTAEYTRINIFACEPFTWGRRVRLYIYIYVRVCIIYTYMLIVKILITRARPENARLSRARGGRRVGCGSRTPARRRAVSSGVEIRRHSRLLCVR